MRSVHSHHHPFIVNINPGEVAFIVQTMVVAPSEGTAVKMAYLVPKAQVEGSLPVVDLNGPTLVVHGHIWVLAIAVHVLVAMLKYHVHSVLCIIISSTENSNGSIIPTLPKQRKKCIAHARE